MIFGNMFYKTHRTSLSKIRQHQSPPSNTLGSNSPDWSGDDHADLMSRDKTKVKEAVRRYLAAKVRNDWTFEWPPTQATEGSQAADMTQHPETLAPRDPANIQDEPNDEEGYQVDDDSDMEAQLDTDGEDNDAQSIYSVMSEDPTHYRARKEWNSDNPIDESMPQPTSISPDADIDPETAEINRRAQLRRELRKEMEWNEGLACFEARRNAWTHARTVRVRAKPETPQTVSSQRSSRRFFFRRSVSSASSAGAISHASMPSEVSPSRGSEKDGGKQLDKVSTSTPSEDTHVESYPVETVVPIPPPILPPNSPLRASITTGNYLQLYDKLIINNLQPSCPINLSDMIGALVTGWKRDGEWPPRPTLPIDPTFTSIEARKKKRASVGHTHDPSGRRLSLTGFLSRDSADSRTGKGVRQSLSKAFGLGSTLPPHMDATSKTTHY